MTTFQPPKRATELIFYVALEDQANAGLFKAAPTLASGDVTVSTDGGAFSNLDTLPAVTPAAGTAVKVTVSVSEMTGDNIYIVFKDASGAEWYDLAINIHTVTDNQFDDLSTLDSTAVTSAVPTVVQIRQEMDSNSTRLDADVSSRSSHNTTGVWASGTRDLTASTNFNDLDSTAVTAAVPTVVQIRQEMDANSTNLDATVSSRSSHNTTGVWASGTRDLTASTNFNDLDSTGIANAVWDEDVVAGHNIADTAGALIDDLGTPGDFKADVSNLDTAVSSRSSHDADAVWAVGARILTASTNFNDLDSTAVTAAVPTVIQIRQEMDANSTRLDADVSSRSSHDTTGVWASGTRTLTSGALDSTGVANAVWDEDIVAGHNVADSAGAILDDVKTKADFKADVSNLDAAVSSRSSHNSTGVWASGTRDLTANTNFNDLNSTGVANAVWDEVLTGATHNVTNSSGKKVRELAHHIIHSGTCQAGSTANTVVLDNSASVTDGAYDPSGISIVGGTGAGQTRLIYEYEGSSRTAVVDRNWKVTPIDDSEFIVFADAGREHVNEGMARGGDTSAITLNALASDSGDAYVSQLVFIRSGTGEDQVRQIVGYNGTSKVATVEEAWDITPDTASGYVILPNHVHRLSQIAPTVWASGTRTLTAGTNLNDISVNDILTTQMTEAYANDGVAPTLAQILFLIQQSVGDFSISGTTITVNKLDGSTQAATYTLDDSADPTSRTRAS